MTAKESQAKGCVIALAIFIAIVAFIYFKNANNADTKPAEIHAKIQFTGQQFIISNLDSFDWTDVKLEINNTFELNAPRIKANSTYTVGALQFSDSRGTRFNPFQLKAKEFSICGNTPNGLACYVGGWE